MRNNKQLVESSIEKIVKKVLKVLKESIDVDVMGQELSKKCGRDVSKINDVFLAALASTNRRTLVKYLSRFFADLEQNSWQVEKTKLYQAGY